MKLTRILKRKLYEGFSKRYGGFIKCSSKRVKKYLTDVEFVGVFDKELGNPLYDLTSLAIMGFVDAIKKTEIFFKLRDELVELAKDCDKVLLLDSSGFNLPLAKKLREVYPNKEIIYYILPQAWAWKRKKSNCFRKILHKTLLNFTF